MNDEKSTWYWYFRAFVKYAEFDGRARRKEYWTFQIITALIGFALGFVLTLAGLTKAAGIVLVLYGLVMFLPSLSVGVRRLHDTGHNCLWLILSIVSWGIIEQMWFGEWSEFSSDPEGTRIGVVVPTLVLTSLLWIPCFCFLLQNSEPRQNKYGPCPKEQARPITTQPSPLDVFPDADSERHETVSLVSRTADVQTSYLQPIKDKLWNEIDAATNRRDLEATSIWQQWLQEANALEAIAGDYAERIKRLQDLFPAPPLLLEQPLEERCDFVEPQPHNLSGQKVQDELIKITIHWKLWDVDKKDEVIFKGKSSQTLRCFYGRLSEEKGIGILAKISRYRVNRGPIISVNPEVDYRYTTGYGEKAIYQSNQIENTQYYVLTHTATEQKKQDLEGLIHYLGYSQKLWEVEIINKIEYWTRQL